MSLVRYQSQIKLILKAKGYFELKRYSEVIKILDEAKLIDIMKNDDFNIINETSDVINMYIKSLYYTSRFDKLIMTSSEVNKLNYEGSSYLVIYYTILSFLGLFDLLGINMYLRQNIIIKAILPQIENCEMSYSSFSNLPEYEKKAMVLINFIYELEREIYVPSSKVSLNNEYLLTRFYDLINLLNDYGFGEELILDITDDISNIFVYKD